MESWNTDSTWAEEIQIQPGVRRENLKQLKEAGGVGRNLKLAAQMGTTAVQHARCPDGHHSRAAQKKGCTLSHQSAQTHTRNPWKSKWWWGKSTRADTWREKTLRAIGEKSWVAMDGSDGHSRKGPKTEKRNHQPRSHEKFYGTNGLIPWQEDLKGFTMDEDHTLILCENLQISRDSGTHVALNSSRAFREASRYGIWYDLTSQIHLLSRLSV